MLVQRADTISSGQVQYVDDNILNSVPRALTVRDTAGEHRYGTGRSAWLVKCGRQIMCNKAMSAEQSCSISKGLADGVDSGL